MTNPKTIEQILEKLSDSDKERVIKALLLLPMLEGSREMRLMMDGLTEVQQNALGEIVLLKVSNEIAEEKSEKLKRAGMSVRRTAIAILQSLITSPNLRAVSDEELCDRALKMAQRLHDAT